MIFRIFQLNTDCQQQQLTHFLVPLTRISLSFRTLLRLHNLRAVIFILLLTTAASEIGVVYLWTARTVDGALSYGIESVLFFFVSITSTTILMRIIEVRKSKSGERI
jgi:hypothetical protein